MQSRPTAFPLLAGLLATLLLGARALACSAGCLKCGARNSCLICDLENFYYLSGGECVHARPSYCLFALSKDQCMFCKPNFYLDRGRCLRTTTLRQNCVQSNIKECLQCEPGFFPFKGPF